MCSAYVSRAFGLGIHVSPTDLEKINRRRRTNKEYIHKKSAINVYGTASKKYSQTLTYLFNTSMLESMKRDTGTSTTKLSNMKTYMMSFVSYSQDMIL